MDLVMVTVAFSFSIFPNKGCDQVLGLGIPRTKVVILALQPQPQISNVKTPTFGTTTPTPTFGTTTPTANFKRKNHNLKQNATKGGGSLT